MTTKDRKSRPRQQPAKTLAQPAPATMTANQVVAYNLTRARQVRGWSQERAAQALEPHLGKRWSKASMSQAERSVAGRVIRSFDAGELVAFAKAFELPVLWFLLPPGPGEVIADGQTLDPGRVGELVDIVLGDEASIEIVTNRMTQLLGQLAPERLSARQQDLYDVAQARSDAVTQAAQGSLEELETQVKKMGDMLAGINARLRSNAERRPNPTRTKRATTKTRR